MTLWTLLAATAAGLGLAAGGTLLLPRQVHVERQATLAAPADTILALAASNTGYQRFNPYLSADPRLQITPFGPDTGIGSGFRFDGKDGKGSQTVAAVTPTSVRYDIDLGAMGRPVQQIAAEPVAEGTRVTWSMEMDIGFNPMARVFGLFMDRMVGQTFEQGLENLAAAT